MTQNSISPRERLIDRTARLRVWLERDALPLWWREGAGRPDDGFYERIGQNGKAMTDDNRRSRVQPRQAYCFAAAGKAGWSGPWQEAVLHGMRWFDRVYRLENGLYGNLADRTGRLIDPSFDLYNQAFAIFANAALAAALPERADAARARAGEILAILRRDYAHPRFGFEEARPPREPLCSNPHMHLFEAALAWEALTAGEPLWADLADEIGTLALTRFIDAESGGLREFFDRDWKPLAGDRGRIMEPGHQFEWSWLLARWGTLRGNGEALAKARRLFAIGEEYGICPRRKVAIMQLNDDFTWADGLARLWPQTEWLKAAVRLASLSGGEERQRYLVSANRALDALDPFLATPVRGLWYDKWPAEGDMIDEPAPASTFYHILCAIYETDEVMSGLDA
ncbi:AGE family epimerase/isomerase [Rhizobiaceae bacterium BDR2-2]|uniref:AGE family epimerase/isomerase n=1 Tax=Ectorhizobium quercum TaxID=2965071 RepID=A0AAE3N1U0_9HYPH|nr:AGE family epimerase/isomerase [Ectorhizobium quercum]MCX8998144.1 AGE family epimerase/isomerase [Ectorhizobium quercum]